MFKDDLDLLPSLCKWDEPAALNLHEFVANWRVGSSIFYLWITSIFVNQKPVVYSFGESQEKKVRGLNEFPTFKPVFPWGIVNFGANPELKKTSLKMWPTSGKPMSLTCTDDVDKWWWLRYVGQPVWLVSLHLSDTWDLAILAICRNPSFEPPILAHVNLWRFGSKTE